MKTTTYTNGNIDIYKGKRDVKAGWQLTLTDGTILQGHSLDADKAVKTARNTAAQNSGQNSCLAARGAVPPHIHALRRKEANENGFKTWKGWEAELKNRRSAYVAACNIEIVPVVDGES